MIVEWGGGGVIMGVSECDVCDCHCFHSRRGDISDCVRETKETEETVHFNSECCLQ